MGIRFSCPNGHKLNVKDFLAGKRGVCPQCGAKFTIPMVGDVPIAELQLPVGVAQSPSIEIPIAPVTSQYAHSVAPLPSAIIAVDEIELAAPSLLPADALPESIIAVQPPILVEPAGDHSAVVATSPRERSRRSQMVVSLLLLGLVILLAGILVWVLQRNAAQTPVEKSDKKAAIEMRSSPLVFAKVETTSGTIVNSRIGARS